MEKIRDEDIQKYENVPTEIAAKYLGKSNPFVFMGLRSQRLPFGSAVKMGKEWSYYISPGLLIAYKNGTLKIEYHVHQNV